MERMRNAIDVDDKNQTCLRMNETTSRAYSSAEELLNSLSHGFGLVISALGAGALITLAALYGDVWQIVSASIFAGSLIMLYAASATYHAARDPRTKRALKIFDHIAIYFLIAGSYTPFLLVNLRGPWGWSLFGVIWGLALFGTVFKLFFAERFKVLSLVLYLLMGWLVVVAVNPLFAELSLKAEIFLVLGGGLYTLGVVFYALERIKFMHGIWHFFVLSGSVMHYFSILFGCILLTRG
jgi:hemolysin III